MLLLAAGTPAEARCLNLVIETWCIKGNMKRARKALAAYKSDFGCQPDEETYALLAGGWARAGKIRESSDVVLSLAEKGFDPTQIKLNELVSDWNKGKWRQVLHCHPHSPDRRRCTRLMHLFICPSACPSSPPVSHPTLPFSLNNPLSLATCSFL